MNTKENNIFWIRVGDKKKPATINLYNENKIYNEKLVKKNSIEYKIWEPYRSKLAAAIMNGLEILPITRKSKVLCLGSFTGTTTNHISDIVGTDGLVFCVAHSNKGTQNIVYEVKNRSNTNLIIHDLRNPSKYPAISEKVNVVYVDIEQPDQTEIAILNCKTHLKTGGYLILIIKTKNKDDTKQSNEIIKGKVKKLSVFFDILQEVNLENYDREHSIVIAKFLEKDNVVDL